MGNFVEMDELKRINDEAKQLSADIKKLFAYKVSKSTVIPNIDDVIEEKGKKLVELRNKLELANRKMVGGYYDRHKKNKRK